MRNVCTNISIIITVKESKRTFYLDISIKRIHHNFHITWQVPIKNDNYSLHRGKNAEIFNHSVFRKLVFLSHQRKTEKVLCGIWIKSVGNLLLCPSHELFSMSAERVVNSIERFVSVKETPPKTRWHSYRKKDWRISLQRLFCVPRTSYFATDCFWVVSIWYFS